MNHENEDAHLVGHHRMMMRYNYLKKRLGSFCGSCFWDCVFSKWSFSILVMIVMNHENEDAHLVDHHRTMMWYNYLKKRFGRWGLSDCILAKWYFSILGLKTSNTRKLRCSSGWSSDDSIPLSQKHFLVFETTRCFYNVIFLHPNQHMLQISHGRTATFSYDSQSQWTRIWLTSLKTGIFHA